MKCITTWLLLAVLGIQGPLFASEGYPWWLMRTAPVSGYITVISDFGIAPTTSVLKLEGNAVVSMTVSGQTTTVTLTGGSTPPSVGIWGLASNLDVTPLLFPLAFTAGLWRVDSDNTIRPGYTDWFDALWTTNSNNDLTPR